MKSTDLFHCVTRDIESLVCSVVIGWFHSILQSLDWVNSHRAGNEHIVSPPTPSSYFFVIIQDCSAFLTTYQAFKKWKAEQQRHPNKQTERKRTRSSVWLKLPHAKWCQRVDGDQTRENVHEPTRCDKGRRRTSERDAFAERFMDATPCTVKSLGSRVAPQTSARN